MRARDFLIEYSREITTQRLGPELLRTFQGEGAARMRRVMGGGAYPDPTTDQDLTDLVIRRLERADPTANKKYMPWLARTYIKGETFLEDVLTQVREYLIKFDTLTRRKKIPAPRNDILRYQNFGDFMTVMDEYPDPDAQELKDRGQASELYQDTQLRAIIPYDQAAACYYGQGTRWCTAKTRGVNYFASYAEDTPLVIIMPVQPAYAGERYQLWFNYSVDGVPVRNEDELMDFYQRGGKDYLINNEEFGQFMNEKDQAVTLKTLKSRFGGSFDGMIDAYLAKFPDEAYRVNKNFESGQV